VTDVQMAVLVQCPGEDSGFRTLYTTTRPFPPGPDDPLTLALSWVDIANSLTMTAPATIPLPTARRVRVELAAVAGAKPNHYGADEARFGQGTNLLLADNSTDETALLGVTSDEAILGIFLQPDVNVDSPVFAAQKAAGLGLAAPHRLQEPDACLAAWRILGAIADLLGLPDLHSDRHAPRRGRPAEMCGHQNRWRILLLRPQAVRRARRTRSRSGSAQSEDECRWPRHSDSSAPDRTGFARSHERADG
jgi:hypothetical protein